MAAATHHRCSYPAFGRLSFYSPGVYQSLDAHYTHSDNIVEHVGSLEFSYIYLGLSSGIAGFASTIGSSNTTVRNSCSQTLILSVTHLITPIAAAIIFTIVAVFSILSYWGFRSRIPLASLLLQVVMDVSKHHKSVYAVAFAALFVQAGISV